MSLIDNFLDGYTPGEWDANPINPGSVYNLSISDIGDHTGLTWVCNGRQNFSSTDKLFDFVVTPAVDTEDPMKNNLYLTASTAETSLLKGLGLPSVFVALDVSDGTNQYTFYHGYIAIGRGGAIHA